MCREKEEDSQVSPVWRACLVEDYSCGYSEVLKGGLQKGQRLLRRIAAINHYEHGIRVPAGLTHAAHHALVQFAPVLLHHMKEYCASKHFRVIWPGDIYCIGAEMSSVLHGLWAGALAEGKVPVGSSALAATQGVGRQAYPGRCTGSRPQSALL